MRRCEQCGRLVEPQLLICPDCRSPLIPLQPFGSRLRVRVIFGILLIAMTFLVWILIRRLIR
jgi:hypothetical protein